MKRLLRVFQTKGEADAADTDYWLRRPVPERIAAVEILRAFRHGTSARLARVLVVAQREQGAVPGDRLQKQLKPAIWPQKQLPKTKKRR